MKWIIYALMAIKRAFITEITANPRQAVRYYRKKGVKIGESTLLYNVIIDNKRPFLVSIGNGCVLTTCRLLTHDASTNNAIGYTRVGGIDIGNNVFVGAGSIILPNVKIGNNVIVGAGTVVAKSIPDNSVCVGSPMRIISSYDDFKKKHQDNLKIQKVFSDEELCKTDETSLKDIAFVYGGYVEN